MANPPANKPVASGRPRRPSPAPPSAVQGGAMLAAARQGPRNKAAEKQQINQIVKLGMAFVIGVCLVLGIIFGIKAMQGPPQPLLGNDAQVRKEMQRVTYEEIRSWLSQGHGRTLMGHAEAESSSLAEEIYKLNPKQVLAGGSRMSMHLIIELPDDVESRTMLIAWHNHWTAKYGHFAPAERDFGQRYLMAQMPANR